MTSTGRSWIAVAALAPWCALLAACTVSTETNPPAGSLYKYPTEASFCTALAAAECGATVVEACYGQTSQDNTDQCVSARSVQAVCRTIPGLEGADYAGVRYDPAAADACVEHRRSIYADAKLTRAEVDAIAEKCIGVFSKGQGLGGACTTDIDCDTKTGLSCVLKGGQSAGECQEPITVGPGDDCSSPESVCESGQFCNTDGFCFVGYGEGKACGADKPCQEGLLCVADEAAGSLCAAKAADGEACTDGAACEGTFCNKPVGGESGVCTGALTLTQIGQSCEAFLP